MPGADEDERVKKLYSKALMGSGAFKSLIRNMLEEQASPFTSIIDRMPPPRTDENRAPEGFARTLRSPRPTGGKATGLIETARNFFKKQPPTQPPKPQSRGGTLLFSYADDSGPVRGLRSDLIILDEVQDLVDDFSLIERPTSPIIQDRPQWGESQLLGAFKDMQDSTLYRQEIMGTWPKEEPPLTSKPLFRREDLMRAYERGLISQKALMEGLDIRATDPPPKEPIVWSAPEPMTPEFVKSKFELMAYQSDVRKILADNVLRDVEEQEGRDMARIAAQIAASRPAPAPPAVTPIVNPDYGDAYRVIEAGRLGGRTPRKTSWRTMDSILLRRPRVKVNQQPGLGPGSTQAPKLRAYSAMSESRNEPYVYVPEHVEDRRCLNCREYVKMSQDMDRPGGQRVLCGECWSLKKTDRTAYEARIKRMPPTPTDKLGVPVYQCLPAPNLP